MLSVGINELYCFWGGRGVVKTYQLYSSKSEAIDVIVIIFVLLFPLSSELDVGAEHE